MLEDINNQEIKVLLTNDTNIWKQRLKEPTQCSHWGRLAKSLRFPLGINDAMVIVLAGRFLSSCSPWTLARGLANSPGAGCFFYASESAPGIFFKILY